MKRVLKVAAGLAGLALLLVLMAALVAGWFVHSRQPVREGTLDLANLSAPVQVQYDERGVPHIQAANEADLYRALGYVHAQDRLFQMEALRRLANGELAEVFGADLIETDKLFRTLGLRTYARDYVSRMDMNSPPAQALLAYLDGVNQYQATNKPPLEFSLLHIPRRTFLPEDVVAISGYFAYSFAAAFKTEPVMTFVRDKLGEAYLRTFDLEWHTMGVIQPSDLSAADWDGLNRVATASHDAMEILGVPLFQGSNAWAVAGGHTASGKPILAGDPHIAFAVPAVWYEAHLTAPGFNLYGHFLALNPFALLGHNGKFGWSLTMFENDDMDMIQEKTNPDNPNQIWLGEQWVDMASRTETIAVRDAPPVQIRLRSSPRGPVITDAFQESYGRVPISLWWTFLAVDNRLMEAFYDLNRADTRDKARAAAAKVGAPGLNIVWANAQGDIAWWAAGRLVQRPAGVNPMFILNAATGEAEKPGFYNFSFNPQEENPPRGYVVSANNQPFTGGGPPVPGYYLLPDRVRRLDALLREPDTRWDTESTKALQLDVCNDYPKRVLKTALPLLQAVVTDENEKAFLEPLQRWDGCYTKDSVAATLFSQFSYELAKAAFADELGDAHFRNLLGTPALDHALPLLLSDAQSPWWDNVNTALVENRYETVRIAWVNTLAHLQGLYGSSLLDWTWGATHTLTHKHALGRVRPLNLLLNVGPFPVPGGRETPNNLSSRVGPAPWAVAFGPSTRRIIDFAHPDQAVGINPVGQSGVPFDSHFSDQAEHYVDGQYVAEHLSTQDVTANTRSTLTLNPAR
jgi:penicillin amidase